MNVVYALLVDHHSALASPSEVQESVDKVLDSVPLDEEDPETWGMTEEQEAAALAWVAQIPPPDVTA